MPVLVDDKLGTIAGPDSSNTSGSQYLDPDEVWIYTKTVTISEDTTNTATVSGTFVDDQVVHLASASANVTVGTEEVTPPADNGGGTSGTETEVSGAIPKTATPYYNVLAIGSALLLIGAVGVAVAARARRT
jgi:hypothetical protein